MKESRSNTEFMQYSNSTIWYCPLWGLCCPLYPLPTQQSSSQRRSDHRSSGDCSSLRELSTSTPSEQPFCVSHRAQPDRFQRNTGSTLRVMSTLMCARVTSLDSAQALPKNREGSDLSPPNPTAGVTLPRPPLRAVTPKNPTRENPLPGLSRQKNSVNASSEIQ